MNGVSIITGFLLLAISGGASLAQDQARAPANPNAAQAQTDEDTSAKQIDDLRHSRIGTVNAISKLNQIRQGEEQLLSSMQDQEKLLEKRLSILDGDPPLCPEDYERRLAQFKSSQEKVSAALSAAKAATPSDPKAIENFGSQLSDINDFLDEIERRKDLAAKQTQQYAAQKADLTSQINRTRSDIATIKSNIDQTQSDIDKDTQNLLNIEDQLAVVTIY
jgi:chromosome segregation ATPase